MTHTLKQWRMCKTPIRIGYTQFDVSHNRKKYAICERKKTETQMQL